MVGVVLLQLAIAAVVGVVQAVVGGISAVAPGGGDPLVGCRSFAPYENVMYELEAALAQSRQAIGKVHLGDSKETVLSILSAPQGSPPLNFFKREAPSQIAIYYLRTNWIPDNCLTDDELTPFIFRDGILVSIGWRTLSGPKSFGTPDIDNSQGNSDSAP
jgi:hypothetical protein